MKRRFQFALLLLLPLLLVGILREQRSWQPKVIFESNGANEIAISPDGKTLAISPSTIYLSTLSRSDGVYLRLIDATSGKLQRHILPHGYWSNLTFSPDGTKICGQILKQSGYYLAVYDLKKPTAPKQVKVLHPISRLFWLRKSDEIMGFSMHSDSNSVWNAKTLKRTRSFFAVREHLRDTQISPDGTMIARAIGSPLQKGARPSGEKWNLRLWSARDGKVVRTLTSDDKRRSMLAISQTSDLLAAVRENTNSYSIEIWHPRNGQLLKTISVDMPLSRVAPLAGLKFSPNGNLLAVSYRGHISLWNVESGKWLRELEMDNNHIDRFCFSPDGIFIYSASRTTITRHRIR